jgi:hypothetical protein
MDEETSWLLATELRNTSKLVLDFHSTYPTIPEVHDLQSKYKYKSLFVLDPCEYNYLITNILTITPSR